MLQAWQDGYVLPLNLVLADVRSLVATLSPSVHTLTRLLLPRTAREIRLFPHHRALRVAFDRDPEILSHPAGLDLDLTDFTIGDIVPPDVWSRWQLPQDGTDHEARLWRETVSPAVLLLQYVGAGTSAAVTIGATTLSTVVLGGPGGEDLALDLTTAPSSTLGDLAAAINALAAYVCTPAPTALDTDLTAYGLQPVAGEDILTAPLALREAMLVDVTLVLE